MRKIKVPEAVEGSWNMPFILPVMEKTILLLNKLKEAECLSSYIGHRAIGVVYNPEHERFGIMSQRFYQSDMMPLFFLMKQRLTSDTYPAGRKRNS